MKKSVLLGAIIFVLAMFWIFQFCRAAEIESYFKMGTINVRDGAINEGHKSLVAVGFNLGTDPTKKFQGLLTLEGWTMGEPSDEDGEIPNNGIGFMFEGRRNFFLKKNLKIFPYVGAGWRHWERDGSEKTIGQWMKINFADIKIGLGAEYKMFFARAGARRPVWINKSEFDPGIGFESEVGLKIKKIKISLFYDRFSFSNNNNFDVNFYGGRIGYLF